MTTLSKTVQEAIAGFLSLTTNGWPTELAFDCMYDGVSKEISKEKFLNAIQLTGNTIAAL